MVIDIQHGLLLCLQILNEQTEGFFDEVSKSLSVDEEGFFTKVNKRLSDDGKAYLLHINFEQIYDTPFQLYWDIDLDSFAAKSLTVIFDEAENSKLLIQNKIALLEITMMSQVQRETRGDLETKKTELLAQLQSGLTALDKLPPADFRLWVDAIRMRNIFGINKLISTFGVIPLGQFFIADLFQLINLLPMKDTTDFLPRVLGFIENQLQSYCRSSDVNQKKQLRMMLSGADQRFGLSPLHQAVTRQDNAVISMIEGFIKELTEHGEIVDYYDPKSPHPIGRYHYATIALMFRNLDFINDFLSSTISDAQEKRPFDFQWLTPLVDIVQRDMPYISIHQPIYVYWVELEDRFLKTDDPRQQSVIQEVMTKFLSELLPRLDKQLSDGCGDAFLPHADDDHSLRELMHLKDQAFFILPKPLHILELMLFIHSAEKRIIAGSFNFSQLICKIVRRTQLYDFLNILILTLPKNTLEILQSFDMYLLAEQEDDKKINLSKMKMFESKDFCSLLLDTQLFAMNEDIQSNLIKFKALDDIMTWCNPVNKRLHWERILEGKKDEFLKWFRSIYHKNAADRTIKYAISDILLYLVDTVKIPLLKNSEKKWLEFFVDHGEWNLLFLPHLCGSGSLCAPKTLKRDKHKEKYLQTFLDGIPSLLATLSDDHSDAMDIALDFLKHFIPEEAQKRATDWFEEGVIKLIEDLAGSRSDRAVGYSYSVTALANFLCSKKEHCRLHSLTSEQKAYLRPYLLLGSDAELLLTEDVKKHPSAASGAQTSRKKAVPTFVLKEGSPMYIFIQHCTDNIWAQHHSITVCDDVPSELVETIYKDLQPASKRAIDEAKLVAQMKQEGFEKAAKRIITQRLEQLIKNKKNKAKNAKNAAVVLTKMPTDLKPKDSKRNKRKNLAKKDKRSNPVLFNVVNDSENKFETASPLAAETASLPAPETASPLAPETASTPAPETVSLPLEPQPRAGAGGWAREDEDIGTGVDRDTLTALAGQSEEDSSFTYTGLLDTHRAFMGQKKSSAQKQKYYSWLANTIKVNFARLPLSWEDLVQAQRLKPQDITLINLSIIKHIQTLGIDPETSVYINGSDAVFAFLNKINRTFCSGDIPIYESAVDVDILCLLSDPSKMDAVKEQANKHFLEREKIQLKTGPNYVHLKFGNKDALPGSKHLPSKLDLAIGVEGLLEEPDINLAKGRLNINFRDGTLRPEAFERALNSLHYNPYINRFCVKAEFVKGIAVDGRDILLSLKTALKFVVAGNVILDDELIHKLIDSVFKRNQINLMIQSLRPRSMVFFPTALSPRLRPLNVLQEAIRIAQQNEWLHYSTVIY